MKFAFLRRNIVAGALGLALVAAFAAACGTTEVVKTVEVEKPVEVIKEVVKEVPVEVVVEKQVVKEVPKEVVVTQEKIVTVEVEKPIEVVTEKVVIQEVEVAGATVEKEVIKEVVVEKIVEVEAKTAVTYPVAGSQLNVAVKDVGPAVYHRPNATFPYYPYLSLLGLGETLVDFADDGQTIVSKVASSWVLGDDGITFSIERGIPFHDSSYGTVSAEDVEFTFVENAREGTRVPNGGYYNMDFQPMEIKDSHTVFWPWKAGLTVRWPWAAVDDVAGAPIMSKKYYDAEGEEVANAHPNTTGPYKLVDHIADDMIILEGVQNHWRLNPGYERVKIFEVPEQATRIAMFKAGQSDILDVAMPLLDQVIDLPGITFAYAAVTNTTGAGVNFGGNWQQRELLDGTPVAEGLHVPQTQFPWVGTPGNAAEQESARRVRLAFSKAIDRNAINDAILFGQGCLVIVDRISTCNLYHDDAWIHDAETDMYNPDDARAILQAEGVPDGYEFQYWTPEGISDTAVEIEMAFAQYWEEVGLKPIIENSLYSVRRPEIALGEKGGLKDVWVAAWGGNTVSPHSFTDTIIEWSEDYSWNAGWSHPYANELVAELQTTLDSETAWTGVLHDYGDFMSNYMGSFGTLSWFDPWVANDSIAEINISFYSANLPELESIRPVVD
jgi:ABC-type transport system substrate-binding protein